MTRANRLGRSAVCAVALFTALLAAARPAGAWVRYLSDSGCPYSWRTRSIAITAFPHGVAGLTVEQAAAAIGNSVDAWTLRNLALGGCTDLDLKLTVKAESSLAPTARYDHVNIVAFRTDDWCAPKADGTPDPTCSDRHDPSALAITSVFAKGYGEIVDADIEVNGVNFLWGDLVEMPDPNRQDLQNALTHEVGHFIGLDHTCDTGASERVPTDENGDAIPSCDSAPPDVKATTMFASATPGDVSKRTLEADDRGAVCAIYPAGAVDMLACPAPERGGGGCAIAPVDAPAPGVAGSLRWPVGAGAALLLATTTWLSARRRTARRRSSAPPS